MQVYVDTIETGNNIKRLMEQNNVTKHHIANACGFTSTMPIYKWIHGDCMPSIDNLVILAMLFNCSLDDIIARDYIY